MHLKLINKIHKLSKTGEAYYELQFEYPDGSKQVKYWVWSYVHNDTNSLQHVWNAVEQAEVNKVYALHFKKAMIADRLQFVITLLNRIDLPIKFLS